MNFIPFIAGIFVSSYFQNPKFKTDIDKMIVSLAGQGIDMVNKFSGGDNNVRQEQQAN